MNEKKLKKFDLYSNGYIEEFADGDSYLERNEIVYDDNATDRIHTIKETDTLTRLASTYFKGKIANAHQYWWVIADTNDIDNPMDLTGLIGQDIVIPDPILFDLKS